MPQPDGADLVWTAETDSGQKDFYSPDELHNQKLKLAFSLVKRCTGSWLFWGEECRKEVILKKQDLDFIFPAYSTTERLPAE